MTASGSWRRFCLLVCMALSSLTPRWRLTALGLRRRFEVRLSELGLNIDAATVRLVLDVLGYASADFDPQAGRRVLVEVVRNVVRQQVALGPLLIVAEDLHWMDSSSQAALGDLVPELASLACLFVATGRSVWAPPWPSQRVVLTPLGVTESRRMIVAFLGR